MNVPTVEFSDMPTDREADLLYGFLFEGDLGWERWIFENHPGIEKVMEFRMEEERIAFLSEFAKRVRERDHDRIVANTAKYRAAWEAIGAEYFAQLAGIMGIAWPIDRPTVSAMVSINPICPRFLDEWSFSIFYDFGDIRDAVEVIAHETCHFLYFEKWKQLFPGMDPDRYELPHVEWHISEILAPIILNDPRVQRLIGKRAAFYQLHEEIRIGNRSVPEHFARLYRASGSDFDRFLREAYSEILRQKEKFFSDDSGS